MQGTATIDGEAVVCCPKTGLSLFDSLHSGRFDREIILCGFDLLELNGTDFRPLRLEQRKGSSPSCYGGSPAGSR